MIWFFLLVLLIIAIGFYNKMSNQLEQLHDDFEALKKQLQQQKSDVSQLRAKLSNNSEHATQAKQTTSALAKQQVSDKSIFVAPPLLSSASNAGSQVIQQPLVAASLGNDDYPIYTLVISKIIFNLLPAATPLPHIIEPVKSLVDNTNNSLAKKTSIKPIMEPDERSLPIVTSLFNSLKNWFLGGNLVVRVGVLVLLVGVVLLLRLVSEYFETPIELKLAAIAVIGFGLAGLGLKLTSKRFAYGITLQGAGLAIAYLTTFFAYNVYEVLASLPSFIALGGISALTIGLAVRQNAFPLALLALGGGFFAPLLTATDTGSLTVLFSYYLLLNVAVAIIAHYKTWKVLNVLGVAVTFGLAYYFGGFATSSSEINEQRWSLVILVALHLALYLFIAIRYTQQIIAYNLSHEASTATLATTLAAAPANHNKPASSLYLYPMDIGLLFSVPVLAFGLFAALLNDIDNALTLTSAILGAVYLSLGWLFTRRSQRYALITEGMLALGFGFLALVIPLAFDAEWLAVGWSIQGLALVWFGRRSLRAWLVLFGLLLQAVSVGLLCLYTFSNEATALALSISAIAALSTVFILRASNSPSILLNINSQASNNAINSDSQEDINIEVAKYANALSISNQAAQQWLMSINTQSAAFNTVWRNSAFINLLTFMAVVWSIYVLVNDFDVWLNPWQLATTTLIALATLTSLSIYRLINRYRAWAEIRYFSHAVLSLFYLALVLQLPQKYEFNYQWSAIHWLIFAALAFGWIIIAQLWLKTWYSTSVVDKNANTEAKRYSLYHYSSWLATGILVLAAAIYYNWSDADGVLTVAIISVSLMALMRVAQSQLASVLPWFDWHKALVGCSYLFVPALLIWVVITNGYHDGIVWNLPYIPVLNLYDIAVLLAITYGLTVYYVAQNGYILQSTATSTEQIANSLSKRLNILLKVIGIIGFWLLSSILVRTLHAYANTPLWLDGAWGDDKVQTSLTILWTLTALIATFMSSRNGKRFWWFMGIGLLGVVVIKLVLIDLSQTGAILRVVSFLVAGSLILLIGYLAPLPPEHDKEINKVKKSNDANGVD